VLGLALAVVAIALPDSLNPTLIVGAIYLTLSPRPFEHTLAFTAAAFAVTLAGGLIIAVGLGDLILSLVPKPSQTVKYEILAVVGFVLLIGSLVLWLRRRSVAEGEPPSKRPPARQGGSAALIGGGIAGVELLTAFPYFAAIAMIVGSSEPAPGKVALLILYDVVYVLPLIAIVIVCAVMGDRAGRKLAPVGDWIALRWPVVVAPLAAAAGIGLMTYGIVNLS
jgi:hypothetical protein